MRKQDKELTIISVTHDMEEAYLSDRCIVLNKGKVVEDGKPIDIFKDKEKLKSISLDLPFVLKVKDSLNELGYKIPNDIMTIEKLSEFLCQSK